MAIDSADPHSGRQLTRLMPGGFHLGDSELARCYDRIREELVETIALNETLGAPSELVTEKLFGAIDAEETRAPRRRPQRLSRTSVTASP